MATADQVTATAGQPLTNVIRVIQRLKNGPHSIVGRLEMGMAEKWPSVAMI